MLEGCTDSAPLRCSSLREDTRSAWAFVMCAVPFGWARDALNWKDFADYHGNVV